MKLSVVVPCYNEEENIPLILSRFDKLINNRDIEVILVNNGSTDNSEQILSSLVPNYSFAKIVVVEKNQGYGYGILRGLSEADGEYVGWTHADMQTDPKDVIKAYDLIKKEDQINIFVKGRRIGRPLIDVFFTIGMSIFETTLFKSKLNDINAQPNIFPKSFFKEWIYPPSDFSLDLYAFYMARKRNLKVFRFPVEFSKRLHGTSKWNTGFKSKIKFIQRTLKFSFELKRREKAFIQR